MNDSEIEDRIRNGRRASGLLTAFAVFLFAIPVVFIVGVCLFWNISMSMMD